MPGSASVAEPITEEVVQFGNLVDFGDCFFHVIGDSVEFDGVAVDGDVGGSWVIISGLTDGANIDHGFAGTEAILEADLFGFEEVEGIGEDTRDVGMTLEAGFFDEGEDFLHLHLIVDVIGEDVFVEWIAGGAVDVESFGVFVTVAAIEFTEEVPAAFGAGAGGAFEDRAGPEDGSFCGGVEANGVEECSLVVVAEQAHLQVHDEVDAFGRIGAIADDVSEAVDIGDALAADIGEDGLERFEVSVDVADQRSQWSIPGEWYRVLSGHRGRKCKKKVYAAGGIGTSASGGGWRLEGRISILAGRICGGIRQIYAGGVTNSGKSDGCFGLLMAALVCEFVGF